MIIREPIAILLALFASIGWGFSPTLFKRTTKHIGPVHFGNMDRKRVFRLLSRPPFILGIVLNIVCGIIYLIALSAAKVSVLGPLLALVYPTQALSARFLIKEPISKMDALSVVGVTLGVGMIATFSVGYG